MQAESASCYVGQLLNYIDSTYHWPFPTMPAKVQTETCCSSDCVQRITVLGWIQFSSNCFLVFTKLCQSAAAMIVVSKMYSTQGLPGVLNVIYTTWL